ncbi:response regulator transcription factor [Cellulomonas edaphi]|uniref:Response regulator transcription factor n=1 Tax=Cellulomonas edaphi TaxID=3053468 RepID=A0ABT7S9F9_9CELL|nr:response regulator transcription factor [Cellulomons edaphi]MDM7832257.1 response regulator transcription factor [Cellulomons edaphi]
MVKRKILRVAVVEDEGLLRSMLTEIIEAHPGMTVVHALPDATTARRELLPGTADVVVMDVDLGDGNGVALSVVLQRADPELRILLLSSHNLMPLVLSVRNEASSPWSYLSKRSSLDRATLLRAIERTAEGQVVLDPELSRRAVARADSQLQALSPAQMSVLRLVATGLPNSAIGETLEITQRSVQNHLFAIYQTLGISSKEAYPRVAAVLRFMQETASA